LRFIDAVKYESDELAGLLDKLCHEDVVQMPPALGGTQSLRVNIRVARLADWCSERGLPTDDASRIREDMRCFYNDGYQEDEPMADLLNYRTMSAIPQGVIPCLQLEKYLEFWAPAAASKQDLEPNKLRIEETAGAQAAAKPARLAQDRVAASVDQWKRDRHLPWTSAYWGPGGSGEKCIVL
jgi:hypothetical protein